MAVKTITDSSFQTEVLDSETPVLVHFWADWSLPCRRLRAVFDAVSVEIGEKVVFAELNIDDNPDVTLSFGVLYVPKIVLFLGGMPTESLSGSPRKSDIKNLALGSI